MDTWKDELKKALEAGEREFGLLDAHHTIKHNLVQRCEELLAEQLQPEWPQQSTRVSTEGEQF